MSFTVYVPGFWYVYDGDATIEVPPSPNSHAHIVGPPVDKSVNWTVSGDVPVVGFAEKSAKIPDPPTEM